MKIIILFLLMTTTVIGTNAQQVIPLYPNGVPNSKEDTAVKEKQETESDGVELVSNVTDPTLTAFLPAKDKANGTAIIICPGGGYAFLAINLEGYDEAKVFQQWGIAAFVLKYRLPDDKIMVDKSIAPLQDAQRGIQLVRMHAKEWNINPDRIGIMGFSAGGHVASTAGTHFNHAYIDNPDHAILRPDFMILCYPVISMTDSLAHMGSRINLLGNHPTPDQIKEFSNELQVTDQTPPAFIMQSSEDNTVNPLNSVEMYVALLKHHVPAELHMYEKGPHGFGMHNPDEKDQWMDWLHDWMEANGWLAK
jgi:acetyl esterase/lipase